MNTLTDFGDIAVLLPLCAVMLLWLLAMRSPSVAAWWLAAVALCTGGTALLKICFGACPVGHDLTSPSGHSSLSTLVFGALAMMLSVDLQRGWQRMAVVGATTCFVLVIAISRSLLGKHTVIEIVLGILIGVVALAIFAQGYLRQRYLRHQSVGVSSIALLLSVMVIALLLRGREFSGEQVLHAIGHHFDLESLMCGQLLPISTEASH
jgi:membrane-associated phospholipid phosphatase